MIGYSRSPNTSYGRRKQVLSNKGFNKEASTQPQTLTHKATTHSTTNSLYTWQFLIKLKYCFGEVHFYSSIFVVQRVGFFGKFICMRLVAKMYWRLGVLVSCLRIVTELQIYKQIPEWKNLGPQARSPWTWNIKVLIRPLFYFILRSHEISRPFKFFNIQILT